MRNRRNKPGAEAGTRSERRPASAVWRRPVVFFECAGPSSRLKGVRSGSIFLWTRVRFRSAESPEDSHHRPQFSRSPLSTQPTAPEHASGRAACNRRPCVISTLPAIPAKERIPMKVDMPLTAGRHLLFCLSACHGTGHRTGQPGSLNVPLTTD